MQTYRCQVCGAAPCTPFLERRGVPVHQNMLVDDQHSARNITRGDLRMEVCGECGFVFNSAFDASLLSYGEHYDNTQLHSEFFNGHLDRQVSYLLEKHGAADALIIEIGCGKGEFLRKLIAHPGSNSRGWGFDPSYLGPDSDLEGRLNFQKTFYDASCDLTSADIVICRHVIEHISEPVAFLETLRAALVNSPNARIFFETPCVEWILEHRVVWDFFYEHCSLFTKDSLAKAFELAGFCVTDVHHVFEGQYLWLEAVVGSAGEARADRPRTADLAESYGMHEPAVKARCLQLLHELAAEGPVALWGAGAKGATLANLIDPSAEIIDSVIDVNPRKQGKFIPGSGHAIVSPLEIGARGIRNAILMNPNYASENRIWLRENNIAVNLVEWDF